jgi:hypothetical protein
VVLTNWCTYKDGILETNMALEDMFKSGYGTSMRTPSMMDPGSTAPWSNQGLQIDGGGRDYLPTFNQSDIGWQPEQEAIYGGGYDGNQGPLMQQASPAGYGFNGIPQGADPRYWQGNANNYQWSIDEQGVPSLKVKSADKVGSTVKYMKHGDQWVPDYSSVGQQTWDTNKGAEAIRNALMVMSGPLVGTAGNAMFGPGVVGGLEGAALGASGLGGMSAGTAGLSGTQLASLFGAESAMGGLGSAAASAGGGAGGLGSIVSGAGGSSVGLGDILKYGKMGMGALQALSGGGGQGGSSMTQAGGQGGVSAPRSWLDSLLGVGAGAWSEHQNRDSFKGLNDLFSRMEEQRAPYQQALTRSYTNPNEYLESPEYQALAAVRGNQLNRGAAKAGRLANDVDREVLMQQHAQQGLANYRQGLTSALNANQLPYGTFHEAMRRNANAGGAGFGGLNYSGLPGMVGGAGQGLESLIKLIGGGNFSPNIGGTGIDYTGMNPEMDFPISDPSGYVEVGEPITEFIGASTDWDWSDSNSWMNDINSWFDF